MKKAFPPRVDGSTHSLAATNRRWIILAAFLFSWCVAPLGRSISAAQEGASKEETPPKYELKKDSTIVLFDGKSLAGWKKTNFGGEGEVTVKDGELVLDFGASMTGITYDGKAKLPTTNYEITLEAMRVDGSDFFCGLTFPVGKSHCSFVCGGWGGVVVGLSCVDNYDASENGTTKYLEFDSKKWYKIRVRVTDEAIQCWIDDKQHVNQALEGHKISTRIEMDLSKPLGVATWETSSALRNFKIQLLEKSSK